MTTTTETDRSSSLDSVYDGLHGYIALDDYGTHYEGQIRDLLNAPFLRRLRRIKQLGFVSQSFLSAEHNRYAHALGTMQMMRELVEQLNRTLNFWKRITDGLVSDFHFLEPLPLSRRIEATKEHLLVAALLQDVGEYPFAKATEFFFQPMQRTKKELRDGFSLNVEEMSNKGLMTLALVFDPGASKLIQRLDKGFLAYLLCGDLGNHKVPGSASRVLRNMLDGSVDADRLDYVYRDTYHTLGERGAAAPLIDTLVEYDANGPVLKHVRPITDFVSKRALLWSSVYHSPENRFRVILLRTIFEELSKNARFRKSIQKGELFAQNQSTFLEFDDRSVERMVEALASYRKSYDISPNANIALEILSTGNLDHTEYSYRWVPFTRDQDADLRPQDVLPSGFFFDLYTDYKDHSLYDLGSIRVRGSRYETNDGGLADGIVPLEQCVGPFTAVLKMPWPSVPMPGHMAWFEPGSERRQGNGWEKLEEYRRGADDEVLRGQLLTNDPMLDGKITFDTRSHGTGPSIFLSFCWSDHQLINKIAEFLRGEKKRFFALAGDYIGIGATIVQNSKAAVHEADAVILVYSEAYAERYKKYSNTGAIAAEVTEMCSIREKRDLPIAVVSLEEHQFLPDKLPWDKLGYPNLVPVVAPLRAASAEVIERVVSDALNHIERSATRSKGKTAAKRKK